MTRTSGVKFERDSTGLKRYVRIDLKMHGKEIEPFLQKINSSSNSTFDNEWSDSLSPEQFKKIMHTRINEWREK